MKPRPRANTLRYASVWEDADVLCRALAPVARGGRLLSIASAGDNALALLTLDPDEVVAVDYNPAQIACLELRSAAFRALEYEDLLAFLGVTADRSRSRTYSSLRADLTGGTRSFWDARPRAVAGGIIHAGRFEGYLRAFRRWVLPLVHPRSRIESLLAPRSLAEREQFYRREWDTPRWRLLFRLFVHPKVMARLGRDPAFFAHAEGSLPDRLLQATRTGLVEQPTAGNPYLTYILNGTYSPSALPRYLRREHYSVIRAGLDRLRTVCARLEDVVARDRDGFSGLNLSDVFEYLSPEEHQRLYRSILAASRPGARLVYWNMQVPRSLPASCGRRAARLDALSDTLEREGRVWFYRSLHVDEVRGAPAPVSTPGIEVGAPC